MRNTLLAALAAGMLSLSPPARATPSQEREPASAGARERAARPQHGTERDVARYRARETASPAAKSYRGGDGVVVIGVSTVTVVLAVVLLVVLL